MGPQVPFLPLPFGKSCSFLSFLNVIHLILYICCKISNKVDKTKQNKLINYFILL